MFTVHFGSDLSSNCTMTQDGTALTKTGHWSYDDDDKEITVLASYLTSLAAGTYTFVATGNSGIAEDRVTFTITKA